MDHADLRYRAELAFERLEHRLRPTLATLPHDVQHLFFARLQTQMPDILEALLTLYGTHYDFYYHLEQVLLTAASYYTERSSHLRQLDSQREADPMWFQSQKMIGGVIYIDLFAGNLAGVREKIPYFQELGLTYLHLMPLFKAPDDNNDGGYAVSSYREVNPPLGTMEELAELATALRARGISLVVDFVYNHTSDEHEWAQKALAGDRHYQHYYYMFPDRTMPDQYEAHLREIFPEQAPGSFTYQPKIDRWVWTTFNTFQWDLNYRNPDVFREMLGEMLFLANNGIEVLRLDAVAFTWKELGTSCENLPQAHTIIQAYAALLKVVAPALLLKSEAIVHPDEVARYFGTGDKAGKECQLSYHPLLMVLLWDALATRKTDMLYVAMQHRYQVPTGCAWVNYVRCHDDIGWGFADEDAAQVGINGYDHRQFLNQFYTGQFEGSFARGLPFNYNPKTGDMRISGMTASLGGLEAAQETNDAFATEQALRRIGLIHSIIFSIGGIPLLYLNDEIGVLNDYTYENDPAKAADNRWVHRPTTNWAQSARRNDPKTLEGRIFANFRQLIALRQALVGLANQDMKLIYTDNPHVFAYLRGFGTADRVLVLANFGDQLQQLDVQMLTAQGMRLDVIDLISNTTPLSENGYIVLEPYQYMWIVKQ